jgi:hypothetical protein
MRYWAFLAAKLCAVAAIAYFTASGLSAIYPYSHRSNDNLAYTFGVLGLILLWTGLMYAAILDTRYRCRTCLRRLRMPVKTGSWSHILFGSSKTEYICPYGHGTLKVFELQITGPHPPDWKQHKDIWKELFSTQETQK